jgi:hypothetical protein
MSDDSFASQWLTRAEAARYVGAAGESTIRAAEEKGLPCLRDADGQIWHWPESLDQWPWRGKRPSAAERERILRSVARARQQNARAREQREAMSLEREFAKWEAERSARAAQDEAEARMRADVRRKNEEVRTAFEMGHMTERQAGKALGFNLLESRSRMRELVDRGLLREIKGPSERRVEVTSDGPQEVETTWPLCRGAPFYLREDVLAVRTETVAIANDALRAAPAAVRTNSIDDAIAGLLRLFIESGQQKDR